MWNKKTSKNGLLRDACLTSEKTNAHSMRVHRIISHQKYNLEVSIILFRSLTIIFSDGFQLSEIPIPDGKACGVTVFHKRHGIFPAGIGQLTKL